MTLRARNRRQQKKNIPKDSDNWFNEWYPSATKAIKVVCFVTAAYVKSPFCMKEFGIAQAKGKLLVVACEPIAQITAVDATEFPHASNALAYLEGGGQVIFHDTDDIETEIMKFIPRDANDGAAAPEPEPSGALSMPPNFTSPTPASGGGEAYGVGIAAEAMLAEIRLSTYIDVFHSEGYEFVEDLVDAEAKDLEELLTMCGMKKPERKRFERALALNAGSSSGRAGGGAESGGAAAQADAAGAEAARSLEAQHKQMDEQAAALRRQQSAVDKQTATLQAEQVAAKAATAQAATEQTRAAKARRKAAEEEAASLALARRLQQEEQQLLEADRLRLAAEAEATRKAAETKRLADAAQTRVAARRAGVVAELETADAARVVEILRAELAEGELQERGWACVWRRADSKTPGKSNAFGDAAIACGGAEVMVSALEQWQAGPASVLEQALHATWILSRSMVSAGKAKAALAAFAVAGGVEAVVAAMRSHGGVAGVQEAGCGALHNLAVGDAGCLQAIAVAGGIELATAAKQAFAGHAKVQQYSGLLLGLLA